MRRNIQSAEQRAAALVIANERRIGAAEVRRSVEAGELDLAGALADSRAGSLPVRRLLVAQQGCGPVRAGALLRAAGVGESRRVRELTDRQRDRLVRFNGMVLGDVRLELEVEAVVNAEARRAWESRRGVAA